MRFRKKKWIITLLTMVLIFSAIPFQAAAESPASLDFRGGTAGKAESITEQGLSEQPEIEPGQPEKPTAGGSNEDGTPSSADQEISAQDGAGMQKKDGGKTKPSRVQGNPAPLQLMLNPGAWDGPSLEDGESQGGIFGESDEPMTDEEWEELQQLSVQANVTEDPQKKIPTEGDDRQVSLISFIYINGEAYTGGNIQVTEGDNFSYMFTWSPNFKTDENFDWGDGSWFETTLFKVPGLNLAQEPPATSVVIDGIKVGEQKLNYDRDSGEMTYKIVFNRYIQFFDPNTIMAYLQGSGKFNQIFDGKPIEHENDKGTITVVKPEDSGQEQVPGGTGWAPSRPPTFGGRQFAFGKGVKWDSSGETGMEPQIDWRVVFFEYLQKTQKDFLKAETEEAKTQALEAAVSNGNCIITETLDENQQFYSPSGNPSDAGRFGNAPFHLELPVIAAGTDKVLNGSVGSSEVGGAYDGPGEINPYISVRDGEGKDKNGFVQIDGSKANTVEEIQNVKNLVKDKPLSWCITTDPDTRRQTLTINLGILGGTDKTEGITWDMANNKAWPDEQLDKLIADCDVKIKNIEEGIDSPIALLDARRLAVSTLLAGAVNLPANAGNKTELEAALLSWERDYSAWRSHEKVNRLSPLEDENGNLYVPLPDSDLLARFKDVPVNGKGTLFQDTTEYKNYEKSFSNLRSDQKTYLKNRLKYRADWEYAKELYQKTKEFYKDGRVFGFTLKVRSRSVNTSASSYQNSVNIRFDDHDYSAEDSASVKFSTGIIGDYALGSLVLQKADALYDIGEQDKPGDDNPGDDDVPIIQQIEKDKNGLAGAVFELYCGTYDDNGNPVPPDKEHENLAHFLDKDASENGDTYIYTHTGKDEEEVHISGEVTELVTDANGRLVLGRIAGNHPHYLLETKAPEGYYLNDEMLPVSSRQNEITYKLLPNVSRAVSLTKTDSYSNQPVANAEFQLYRKDAGGTETPVTGFTKKTVNGHTGYWKTTGGNDRLLTDADGNLCVHGLDAGAYVIKEVGAPAYETPQTPVEKEFTLAENYDDAKQKDPVYGNLDAQGHKVLWSKDEPLTNAPKTAGLTLTKQDGTSKEELAGAGFTLFRFKGTESEWQTKPNDPTKWKAVKINPSASEEKYFKTDQGTVEVVLPGLPGGLNPTVEAVLSGTDGKVTITDIPVGHYSIGETKVPEDEDKQYVRDYHSYYFDVDADTFDENGNPKEIRLKNGSGDTANPVENNIIYNYTQLVKLKLIKCDSTEGELNLPEDGLIPGKTDGWYYDTSLNIGDKGLAGAKYKLFMQLGPGKPNPNPEEVKEENLLKENLQEYDICLGVGTTNEQGELDISDFKDKNGKPLSDLNMEEYYLIEVKAPEGYQLNRNPILFSLNQNVFPDDGGTPGMVKLAGNKRYDYGIQVLKTAEKKEGEAAKALAGAEFILKEDGTGEPLKVTETEPGVYKVSETGTESVLRTGSDGRFRLTGLKADTNYSLTETKAPQGYQILEKEITVRTPASPEAEGENIIREDNLVLSSVTAENKPLLGRMELYKVDEEEGTALPGATFQLYKSEMKPFPEDHPEFDPENPDILHSVETPVEGGEQITGEDGKIIYENLEWGSYVVREVKAPEGYALDEKRLSFTIDETSFNEKGEALGIIFSPVRNSKGVLGEAILKKVDADNPEKVLPGAHFFLEKQLKNGHWIGYGQGIYITGEDGTIRFKLPLGKYRVTEMKAPDGYMLPEGEGLAMYEFEITEAHAEGNPNKFQIKNQKGATGLVLRKTVSVQDPVTGMENVTDIPIKGVEFEFYRGDDPQGTNPLHFEKEKDGMYKYTESGGETRISTDGDGEIHLLFPESFASENADIELDKMIFCREVSAPGNVVVDKELKLVSDGELEMNQWSMGELGNHLTAEALAQCSVTVVKTDGKSKKPLPGAEFQLYEAVEIEDEHFDLAVGTPQVTDEKGTLTFTNLTPGMTYHIVETKAPKGYVLDSTHHEVVLDENAFDEDLNFKAITINCANYEVMGKAVLKKTDSENQNTPLAGAEFELFRQNDSVADEEVYEHYGEYRYITDEKGEIMIDLPIGKYYWIERAAPLGYELTDPKPIDFEITAENAEAENAVVKTAENTQVPGEKGSVKVVKTAEDGNTPLAGAEFLLYYLSESGNYELYHTQHHITGTDGTLTLKNLPVGSYALKEVKAPAGYDIVSPDRLYPFTISEEALATEISIQNYKAEGTLKVSKEVTGAGDRNKAFRFRVTLEEQGVSGTFGEMEFKNGVCEFTLKHGETKTGSGLPSGMQYTVEEYDNEGYTVTSENASGVISKDTPPVRYVNYMSEGGTVDPNPDPDPPVDPENPNPPVDPENPDKPDPEKPDKPVEPEKPDKPEKPDPDNPDKPGKPGTGENAQGGDSQGVQEPQQNGEAGTPETGDNSMLPLWGVMFILAGGGLAAAAGLRRRERKKQKESQ